MCLILEEISILMEVAIGNSIMGGRTQFGLVRQSMRNTVNFPGKLPRSQIPKPIKHPTTSFVNNSVLSPTTPIGTIGNAKKRLHVKKQIYVAQNRIRSHSGINPRRY